MKSIDYLLKPITQDDLNKAIQKYRDWNVPAVPVVDVGALFELIQGVKRTYRSRFSIIIGQKIKTIPVEEVAYFFS